MKKFVMNGKHWKTSEISETYRKGFYPSKNLLAMYSSLENINQNIMKCGLLFIIMKVVLKNHENSYKTADYPKIFVVIFSP